MEAMQFTVNARAATKDDAKTALAAQFAAYAIGAPAEIDWTLQTAIAGNAIDALQDSDTLDVAVSVSGDLIFAGDLVHSVKIYTEVLLTDRIA
jgi:hypothetical protein